MLQNQSVAFSATNGFPITQTKDDFCIKIEFNSKRTGFGHQYGRRFFVLEHQYGRRDVTWKRTIRSSTSGPVSFNLHIAFVNLVWLSLRLFQTFAGVLREKRPYMLHFKGKHANYISLERSMNVDFGAKIWIAGLLNSAKENRKQPLKWPCAIQLNDRVSNPSALAK